MTVFHWTDGAANGNLSDGANWDQAGAVPTSLDSASISGSYTISSGTVACSVVADSSTIIDGGTFQVNLVLFSSATINGGTVVGNIGMTGATYNGGTIGGTFTASSTMISADPGVTLNTTNCSFSANFSSDVIDSGSTISSGNFNGGFTGTGTTFNGGAGILGACDLTTCTLTAAEFFSQPTCTNCTIDGTCNFDSGLRMIGGDFKGAGTVTGTIDANSVDFTMLSPSATLILGNNDCTYNIGASTFTTPITDNAGTFTGTFSGAINATNSGLSSSCNFPDASNFYNCNIGSSIHFGNGCYVSGGQLGSGTCTDGIIFYNCQINGGTWMGTTYFRGEVDVASGAFTTMDFSTGVTSIAQLTGFTFSSFSLSVGTPAADIVTLGISRGSFSGRSVGDGTRKRTAGFAG